MEKQFKQEETRAIAAMLRPLAWAVLAVCVTGLVLTAAQSLLLVRGCEALGAYYFQATVKASADPLQLQCVYRSSGSEEVPLQILTFPLLAIGALMAVGCLIAGLVLYRSYKPSRNSKG